MCLWCAESFLLCKIYCKVWERERVVYNNCTSEMRAHQGGLVSHNKGWEKEEKICLPFPVLVFFLGYIQGFCAVFEMLFGWKFCWSLETLANDISASVCILMGNTPFVFNYSWTKVYYLKLLKNELLDCVFGCLCVVNSRALFWGYSKNSIDSSL